MRWLYLRARRFGRGYDCAVAAPPTAGRKLPQEKPRSHGPRPAHGTAARGAAATGSRPGPGPEPPGSLLCAVAVDGVTVHLTRASERTVHPCRATGARGGTTAWRQTQRTGPVTGRRDVPEEVNEPASRNARSWRQHFSRCRRPHPRSSPHPRCAPDSSRRAPAAGRIFTPAAPPCHRPSGTRAHPQGPHRRRRRGCTDRRPSIGRPEIFSGVTQSRVT